MRARAPPPVAACTRACLRLTRASGWRARASAAQLLTGNRGRREMVSAVCALRLLAVHLLLFHRCHVDVAALLRGAEAVELPDGRRLQPPPAELRTKLLDRLLCILLHPLDAVRRAPRTHSPNP